MKDEDRPEFGSYRCWQDRDGIHFTQEAGWSDCGHTISRRKAAKFLKELALPKGMDFNSWLRTLTLVEWDTLHWKIHDYADDNFVWIGTDEIEKWGTTSF